MTEPSPGSSDRLDSWKAIAEHLGREVRTVRRWEQKLGLPVRRVPGGRGHSVFAYVSEIDEWLKATPPAGRAEPAEPQAPGAAAIPASTAPGTDVSGAEPSGKRRVKRWAWTIGAAVLLVAAAAGVISWHASRPPIDARTLRFELRGSTLVAAGPSGEERWSYMFPRGETIEPVAGRDGPVTVVDNGAAILMAVGRKRPTASPYLPGQLLWFSPDGVLRRTVSFTDRVTFGGEQFQDWVVTDYSVFEQGGRRRIAVAGHHYRWWPSFVTLFDGDGRPLATFFNAGWVEHVYWVRADRLLISGFSNPRDAGMAALLDTNAMNGAFPAWDDPTYLCASCGRATPLRYVLFPRSEVNTVTGSRFNRAWLEPGPDRIIAHTLEVPIEDSTIGVDALYELTPSLDVIRARYSDRYWDIHRSLQLEEKIHHSQETCPDRDGPRQVDVWDAAGGWRTVRLPATPPAAR